MAECMMFPDDWAKFLEDYSFLDSEEVYTNGSRLIPTFRVEQMMEHYLRKAVADKWIPVTERLPDKEGSYIVRTTSGAITTGRFYTEMAFGPTHYRNTVYVRKASWSRNRNVTHWMPLPEPPMEE